MFSNFIVSVHTFKRVKKQTHHNWFLFNYGRLVTKSCKILPENIANEYHLVDQVHHQMIYDSESVFKKVLRLST